MKHSLQQIGHGTRHMAAILGSWRLLRLGLALLVVVGLCVPTVQELVSQQRYMLDASTIRLVGSTNKNLVKKFSYDAQNAQWQFNKDGIAPDTSSLPGGAGALAALRAQQAQVGGAGKKDKSLYAVNLPLKGDKGVTYYDSNTNLSFSIVPEFKVEDGQERNGQLIYPFQDGGKLIYSAKNNGMKEDIVLSHNIGDSLQFSYQLKLPDTLEAKVQSDGSVGIFSADPTLFGNISYGSNTDQAKIESARLTAPKDHLLFAIPAPIIKQTSANKTAATARFSLEGDELKVYATGMNQLHYPVTVDPSVVVTSSSDFQTGANNEDNIDFSTSGQIGRAALTGGSVSNGWSTAANTFTTARYGQASVTYNGYLYLLGGRSSGTTRYNDIQYSALGSNGIPGTWQTATHPFSGPRENLAAVAYNGYLYVIGGNASGVTNGVQYAQISSTGDIGVWQATSSFTTARQNLGAAAYNGYIYITGGLGGGTSYNDIQYAAVHADGTLGSWVTSTTTLSTVLNGMATVAYNGYLYVIGGSGGGYHNNVQYAALAADGSVGAISNTSSFTNARGYLSGIAYNGYLYITGGTGSTVDYNDVQYAQINANGTVGTWQTSVSISTVRNSASMAVYNGYIYVMGGEDFAGTTFYGDTQYAKIDPAGTTTSYSGTTALSGTNSILTSAGTGAYNGFIYMVGGFTGSTYIATTHYAPLNVNGTIGTWNTTSSLNTAAADAGLAFYNGYAYIVGGTTGSSTYTAVVQYAKINSDGTLGTWATTTALNTAQGFQHAVAYNGYIYVGDGSGGGASNKVAYTSINADGTVNSWTDTSTLNTSRTSESLITYGGYLYAIGGNNLSSVEYAKINSDGTLGTWTLTSSMSVIRAGCDGFVANGYVYMVGGDTSGSGSETAAAEYAPINTDGSLGSWQSNTSMVGTVHRGQISYYNGYVYSVSGKIGGSRVATSYYATINNGGSGVAGSWQSTTGFSNSRSLHASAVYNGYLYLTGGIDSTSTSLSDVQYAKINSDGTLGTWATTTPMANTNYCHAAVAYSGYLYTLGGFDGSGTSRSDVQYAKINSDGTLGTWATTSSMTVSRSELTAAVYNGYVYAMGGETLSVPVSSVEYAKINSDGTLGTWATTSSLIAARYSHSSAVYNGYLYVLGGAYEVSDPKGGTRPVALSSVEYAKINSDGTLGTWATTSNFANARYHHASIVLDGYIYIMGGNDELSTVFSDVQYAPIAANGAIGEWQTTTSLSGTRTNLTANVYNGSIFVIGGSSNIGASNDLTTVEHTPLSSIARMGHYSKLINIGADVMLQGVGYNGSLPGGINNISYRSAASDGVFGVLTPASAMGGGGGEGTCNVSSSTIHYVWLLVTLDGSSTATFPDASSSYLTDVTVNYGVNTNHPDPSVRLHGGKYFNNEIQQPLDACGP